MTVTRMADREQYTDPQAPHHGKHPVRTPTGELSHEAKLQRQRLHRMTAAIVLVLLLAVLAYAAAFDLNSWAEWVVLGGIVSVVVGFMIAVYTR